VSLEQQIKDEVERDIQNHTSSGGCRDRNRGGLVPGLVLILVGSVILLEHLGYIRAEEFWKFWPLLLVTVGVAKLFSPQSRVGGAILILFGGFLQLNKLGYTRLTLGDIWPVILIAVGASLIFGRFQFHKWTPFKLPAASGGSEVLNEFALFGGVERRINVNNFRGGSISAIFGGVEVDFRSADIEGEQAIVQVEAMFGGIEVTVPDRWIVIFQGQSIFGGYTDETRPPVPDVTGTLTRKKLILQGKAVFGGIVVKN
jgi:predicted membrane protein